MSINSIGYFGIFGGGYLSEETKRKLRALGIDPATVTSETQARIIIRDALKKQAVTEVETFEQKLISEAEEELKSNGDTVFQMMNMTANVNRYILGL